MEKNVGGYDRIARFVVGGILLVVGIAAIGGAIAVPSGTVGTALVVLALVVGAVLAVTAATRRCPLNAVAGIDTYERSSGPGSTTEDADGA